MLTNTQVHSEHDTHSQTLRDTRNTTHIHKLSGTRGTRHTLTNSQDTLGTRHTLTNTQGHSEHDTHSQTHGAHKGRDTGLGLGKRGMCKHYSKYRTTDALIGSGTAAEYAPQICSMYSRKDATSGSWSKYWRDPLSAMSRA